MATRIPNNVAAPARQDSIGIGVSSSSVSDNVIAAAALSRNGRPDESFGPEEDSPSCAKERAMLDSQIDEAQGSRKALDDEIKKATKSRDACPRWTEKTSRTGPILMIAANSIGFLAFGILCCLNAARFAVQLTNSWLPTVLFVSVLPVFAVALKFWTGRISRRRRWLLDFFLLTIFIVASGTYIVSLGNHFAIEPELTAASLLQRVDYRLLFTSQIAVEIVLSYVFFSWIARAAQRLDAPVPGKLWQVWDREVQQLKAQRLVIVTQIGEARGRLAELDVIISEEHKRRGALSRLLSHKFGEIDKTLADLKSA